LNITYQLIPSILIPSENPAVNCVQNSSRPGHKTIYNKNGRTDRLLSLEFLLLCGFLCLYQVFQNDHGGGAPFANRAAPIAAPFGF